jgi:hypothetical protein
MFNEPLYNALCAAFSDVVIHGEGTTLTFHEKPTLANKLGKDLRDYKINAKMVEHWGECYAVNCPFCGDTRKRLWVSHAWGGTYEVEGNRVPVSKGLVVCYNERCLNNTDNWVTFCKYIEGSLKPVIVPKESSVVSGGKEAHVEFPSITYRVNGPGADPTVRQYLVDRGYDLDELGNCWDIRSGKIDFYDIPVVVVPVMDSTHCVFWQARYPKGGEIPEFFRDGRRKPKYYLPRGSKKSYLLYNLYNAAQTDYIVLTEGIFDAIRVGRSGVAMFGKDLSSRQLQDLQVLAGRKTVIWIPDKDDPDAYSLAAKRVKAMNNRGLFQGGAHVLDIGDGDPADHTRGDIWASISQLLAKQ